MPADDQSPAAGPHVAGPPDGPAVLLYGDATCPRCQQAVLRLRAAPVRLTWRHLVLRARGPRPRALAGALEAAGRQDAFWPVLDALVGDPGRTEDPDLWELARRLGLDVARFDRDRRDDAAADVIAADLAAGLGAGAVGTPAILVGDGAIEHGIPDAAWIDALLARA
ncbi:DsbA family protein [Patulibacter sp.]|uniref:DsbA family protein n=1 Tax=Patulibacter sp. TaxID=1912859 RepID=UPI00271B524C|nr:DsbA family protein [Patulibacter sp.]MDO9407076.1 DsbA family protein [Patulibacter sp.]